MSPLEAIAGFSVAAGLLTILPGLDTALLARALKRPATIAWLDRVTGGVAFAARLSLSRA